MRIAFGHLVLYLHGYIPFDAAGEYISWQLFNNSYSPIIQLSGRIPASLVNQMIYDIEVNIRGQHFDISNIRRNNTVTFRRYEPLI